MVFFKKRIFTTCLLILLIIFSSYFFIASTRFVKYDVNNLSLAKGADTSSFKSFVSPIKQIEVNGSSNLLFVNLSEKKIQNVLELAGGKFFIKKEVFLENHFKDEIILDVAVKNGLDLYIVTGKVKDENLVSSKLSVLYKLNERLEYSSFKELYNSELSYLEEDYKFLFAEVYFPTKNYEYQDNTAFNGNYENAIFLGAEFNLDNIGKIDDIIMRLVNNKSDKDIRFPKYTLENDIVREDIDFSNLPQKMEFEKHEYIIPQPIFTKKGLTIFTYSKANMFEPDETSLLIVENRNNQTKPIKAVLKKNFGGFYYSKDSIKMIKLNEGKLSYEQI